MRRPALALTQALTLGLIAALAVCVLLGTYTVTIPDFFTLLFLGAVLVGAIIVVLADFMAANLFPGRSFPVGVFTRIFGAPVLMWLLVQNQKEGK